MSRVLLGLSLLIFLGIAQGGIMRQASLGHEQLTQSLIDENGILPVAVLKIVSLDYDGLVADHKFLLALSFIGKSYERNQIVFINKIPFVKKRKGKERISVREWDWFLRQLEISTDLDPWFMDPYYVGNSNLVWDAERYVDANRLLDKGVRHCTWDWLLPFYAGFNTYYFLNNKQGAANYMMVAAARSDAPPLLATLAARLAYEGNQTSNAIIFLRQMLRDVKTSEEKGPIQVRLAALEGIFAIENAVVAYRERFGYLPKSIEELKLSGILLALPDEPYGGRYYLDQTGQVKTTSELGKY